MEVLKIKTKTKIGILILLILSIISIGGVYAEDTTIENTINEDIIAEQTTIINNQTTSSNTAGPFKATTSTTTRLVFNATEVFPYERVNIKAVVTSSSGSNVTYGTVSIYNNNRIISNVTAGGSFNTYGIDPGEYEFYAVYQGYDSGLIIWRSDYASSRSPTATFTIYDDYSLELLADGKNETTIYVGNKVKISNLLHPTGSSSGEISYSLEGGRTRTMEANDYVNMYFQWDGDYVYNASFVNGSKVYKSNKITIHVIKYTPSLSFSVSDNATLGKPVTITPIITANATGNITYYTNGKERTTLNVNQSFTYTPVTKEDLSITLVYNGDDNYTNTSYSKTITAAETDKLVTVTTVEIDKRTINIGESIKVKPIVTHNGEIINGTVTLTIGDTRYNGQSINSVVTHTPTSAGEINVYVLYSGTDNYEASESSFEKVTINKYDSNLVLDLNSTVGYIGDSFLIKGTMISTATGDISVYINNKEVSKISNGGTYTFKPSTVGKFNITLKYNGDTNYNAMEVSQIVDIINSGSFIIRVNGTNELNVNYGDTVVFSSFISPETEKGRVTLLLNGVDTGIKNFNANGNLSYTVTTVGELRFSATYIQNGKTLETSDDVILYVDPMKTVLNLDMDKHSIFIGESVNITARVTAGSTTVNSGLVSYYIGNTLIGEVNLGEKFTYTGSEVGRVNITALYSGEGVYGTSTAVTYILVNNETSNLTEDIVIEENNTNPVINETDEIDDENNTDTNTTPESPEVSILKTTLSGLKVGKTFIISLKDENNNPVSGKTIIFAVNTNTVNLLSDENGQAEYSLEDLEEGSYQISAIFQGDNSHSSSQFSTRITIENSDKSVITLPTYRGVYGDDGVLTGVLVDSEGNIIPGQHIQLTLSRVSNGASKVYDVVSDFAGEFSLPINLAPGLYSVSAYYPGLNAYGFNYNSADKVTSSIIVTSEEDTRRDVVISTELYNNTYPGDGERNKDFVGVCTDGEGKALIGYTLSLRLIRLTSDGSYGASKTYNTVIDYKGEFSLSIYLAPGNYKVIATFEGDDNYAQAFSSEDLIITRD